MEYLFSFIFPVLLVLFFLQAVVQRFGKPVTGWKSTLILVVFALAIVAVPVGGIPLARWLISLNANFSIPFTALLLIKVWQKATGISSVDSTEKQSKTLFETKSIRFFWFFGAVSGLVLYPMALGAAPWDPYLLGWRFSPLFMVMMVLTLYLIYKKESLGVALAFSILAFNLKLLESANFWDYLIDPFFAITSVAVLIKTVYRKLSPYKIHNKKI